MRAPPSRAVVQRRLVWLLWLALLLPIAQAAAMSHALSHAVADGDDDRQAVHQTHCDLCLTAAALSGGALPEQRPSLPHPVARHVAPQVASSGVWFALPTRAYLSRAPPIAQH
jgi:hypothetical protein